MSQKYEEDNKDDDEVIEDEVEDSLKEIADSEDGIKDFYGESTFKAKKTENDGDEYDGASEDFDLDYSQTHLEDFLKS